MDGHTISSQKTTQAPSLLLYSLNYSPELTGIGKYNGEMVEWLAGQGEDIRVICAAPYYPEWKLHAGYSNKSYRTIVGEHTEVTYCPHYIPKQLSTLKRLLHLSSFAISSSIPLVMACFKRPKVMMILQPTLFCTPVALLLCKVFSIKSVLHIQDFELDAMFGLGMSRSNETSFIAKCLFSVERFLLRRFDAVSTISHSMIAKAREKGVLPEKLLLFPNWSDTEFVNPTVSGMALRREWQLAAADKVILYAGNIGAKQGLELVVQAAEKFRNKPDIKFLMVGSGAYREKLESMASELNLSNIIFKPLQAWEKVPAMLAMADVHLVIQKKGVADAVLPSKLTNILSAGGHAVVTAESDTELGRIARKFPGIYSCVAPENLADFVRGLEQEIKLSEKNSYNKIARHYAEVHLNQKAILEQFWSNIYELTHGRIRTNPEKG